MEPETNPLLPKTWEEGEAVCQCSCNPGRALELSEVEGSGWVQKGVDCGEPDASIPQTKIISGAGPPSSGHTEVHFFMLSLVSLQGGVSWMGRQVG